MKDAKPPRDASSVTSMVTKKHGARQPMWCVANALTRVTPHQGAHQASRIESKLRISNQSPEALNAPSGWHEAPRPQVRNHVKTDFSNCAVSWRRKHARQDLNAW